MDRLDAHPGLAVVTMPSATLRHQARDLPLSGRERPVRLLHSRSPTRFRPLAEREGDRLGPAQRPALLGTCGTPRLGEGAPDGHAVLLPQGSHPRRGLGGPRPTRWT